MRPRKSPTRLLSAAGWRSSWTGNWYSRGDRTAVLLLVLTARLRLKQRLLRRGAAAHIADRQFSRLPARHANVGSLVRRAPGGVFRGVVDLRLTLKPAAHVGKHAGFRVRCPADARIQRPQADARRQILRTR